MTDKQVRDERLTVMLAGHETSANAATKTSIAPAPILIFTIS
jgi:cytochrome P450